MPGDVEIYSLSDPRTGIVRYIGKANNSHKRLKSHLRDSRRRDTPVYRWIRQLSEEGMSPVLAVIDRVDSLMWPARERELIASFRASGGAILNVADGGNEPACPKETRAANGRKNAASRNHRLWMLKRDLGSLLKSGHVSEKTKEKMRSRPDVFGQFLNQI